MFAAIVAIHMNTDIKTIPPIFYLKFLRMLWRYDEGRGELKGPSCWCYYWFSELNNDRVSVFTSHRWGWICEILWQKRGGWSSIKKLSYIIILYILELRPISIIQQKYNYVKLEWSYIDLILHMHVQIVTWGNNRLTWIDCRDFNSHVCCYDLQLCLLGSLCCK